MVAVERPVPRQAAQAKPRLGIRPQLIEQDDASLLEWAVRRRRALVTYNVEEFRPIADERLANGDSHLGATQCVERDEDRPIRCTK